MTSENRIKLIEVIDRSGSNVVAEQILTLEKGAAIANQLYRMLINQTDSNKLEMRSKNINEVFNRRRRELGMTPDSGLSSKKVKDIEKKLNEVQELLKS